MLSRRHKVVINRECTPEEAVRLVEFMEDEFGWKERVDFANFVGGGRVQVVQPSESDIEITCEDCGDTFLFSASEQQFYADNNYVAPKRCKPCRNARKESAVQNRNSYASRFIS